MLVLAPGAETPEKPEETTSLIPASETRVKPEGGNYLLISTFWANKSVSSSFLWSLLFSVEDLDEGDEQACDLDLVLAVDNDLDCLRSLRSSLAQAMYSSAFCSLIALGFMTRQRSHDKELCLESRHHKQSSCRTVMNIYPSHLWQGLNPEFFT